MHQGYAQQTLERFLKAREGNVTKANKMLLDCLNWRVQNDIDNILAPNATKKHGRYIGPCLKVLDMTGLKLSALSRIKLLTMISTVDDLNYPEKTETYYIVNAPYVFSACWKVMDYDALPHFCRQESSGSSRRNNDQTLDCFSPNHPFHTELYNYIKQQAAIVKPVAPAKMGSFHVEVPTLESALQNLGNEEAVANGVASLKVNSEQSLRSQRTV